MIGLDPVPWTLLPSGGGGGPRCRRHDRHICESFVARLEREFLDRRRFATQVEARLVVFDFIEGWYNPHRRHSALADLSPLAYEHRTPPRRPTPLTEAAGATA